MTAQEPNRPTYDSFLDFEFTMNFIYLGGAFSDWGPRRTLLVALGAARACEGSWCYSDGWPAIYLYEQGTTAYLGLLLRRGIWQPTLDWGECRDWTVPMTAGMDYALRVKITRPSQSGDVTLLTTINGVQTRCSTTYPGANPAFYPWWPQQFILIDPNFTPASVSMTALTGETMLAKPA